MPFTRPEWGGFLEGERICCGNCDAEIWIERVGTGDLYLMRLGTVETQDCFQCSKLEDVVGCKEDDE
jgi:hypothetical protein